MRVLSLRLRGEKEVTKLLGKRDRGTAVVAAELLDEDDDSSIENEKTAEDSTDEEGGSESESELENTTSVPGMVTSVTCASGDEDVHMQQPAEIIEIIIGDSEDER